MGVKEAGSVTISIIFLRSNQRFQFFIFRYLSRAIISSEMNYWFSVYFHVKLYWLDVAASSIFLLFSDFGRLLFPQRMAQECVHENSVNIFIFVLFLIFIYVVYYYLR